MFKNNSFFLQNNENFFDQTISEKIENMIFFKVNISSIILSQNVMLILMVKSVINFNQYILNYISKNTWKIL